MWFSRAVRRGTMPGPGGGISPGPGRGISSGPVGDRSVGCGGNTPADADRGNAWTLAGEKSAELADDSIASWRLRGL